MDALKECATHFVVVGPVGVLTVGDGGAKDGEHTVEADVVAAIVVAGVAPTLEDDFWFGDGVLLWDVNDATGEETMAAPVG